MRELLEKRARQNHSRRQAFETYTLKSSTLTADLEQLRAMPASRLYRYQNPSPPGLIKSWAGNKNGEFQNQTQYNCRSWRMQVSLIIPSPSTTAIHIDSDSWLLLFWPQDCDGLDQLTCLHIPIAPSNLDIFTSLSNNAILSLKLDRRLLSTQAKQHGRAFEF